MFSACTHHGSNGFYLHNKVVNVLQCAGLNISTSGFFLLLCFVGFFYPLGLKKHSEKEIKYCLNSTGHRNQFSTVLIDKMRKVFLSGLFRCSALKKMKAVFFNIFTENPSLLFSSYFFKAKWKRRWVLREQKNLISEGPKFPPSINVPSSLSETTQQLPFPAQQPMLFSAPGAWRAAAEMSGQEDQATLCQRAELEAGRREMGSPRDLGVTKRRIRMLLGQLEDGGERGFPTCWRRDGGEHNTAASWAPARLTKGKMWVEIGAVRQGCGC